MKQPCDRKCPDRTAGCAANCPKWAEYARWRDGKYERRLRESQVSTAVCEGRIRRGSYDPGAR